MSKDTIIVFTYRYIWKDKNGKLCVKFLTETPEGHNNFINLIKEDANVVSCMREYISEVNFAYIGFTENLKLEEKEKEGDKNEEILD